MHRRRFAISLLVSFGALALTDQTNSPAAPSRVESDTRVEVVEADELSLPDVLERVRLAASGDGWREEGWTDPAIERWLEHVLTSVRKAGHGKELPEAVKFADYKGRGPAGDPRRGQVGRAEASLLVAKRLDVDRLANTIALIDGDAQVGFADNCVIIARGAVDIAHGNGNIVVAGQFIHVSHDGSHRRAVGMNGRQPAQAVQRPMPPASLLLCGGILDVSHAFGTVCAAGESLQISSAWGCVFVNPPNLPAGGGNDSVKLTAL